MKKQKEIIKSPEYWLEEIQDELYRQLKDYMNKNKLSQNDIASKLKVSKSYVSQILNGNFNFTLKKLIELSLLMGRVPDLKFLKFEDYINKGNLLKERRFHNIASQYIIRCDNSPKYLFRVTMDSFKFSIKSKQEFKPNIRKEENSKIDYTLISNN